MYHQISIKDNGIGFEQANAERIFNVFTRLYGMAEYSGTESAFLLNARLPSYGIPATANAQLQCELLKDKWNIKGFVVSDWGSIGEMVDHGYSKDKYKAVLAALESKCLN